MIVPFYGELLLQPIPLELSLNYCSHKCAYCFANLNKPDRRAAPQSIVNLLAECDERDTLEARLLSERYPILLSNKVDPFSESNWRLTLQILELLAALEIPVAFQTKGGKGLFEAMDLIKRSCFYFSITAQDDETAKRIEPGAPSISKRFEMMAALRSKGHHVWAGVNPLVREWIPDVNGFARRLAAEGVRHVFSEVLHLSRDQIANMSEREKEAVSPPGIKKASARSIPQDSIDHELDFIDACRENGIEFACKHWPEPTTVLEPYARCYPRRFPTMTEWTNHVWQTQEPGAELTFRDFFEFMSPLFPDIRNKSLGHYVHSCSRNLGRRIRFASGTCFEDILRVIWIEREHRMNPSRSRAFKKKFELNAAGEKIFQMDDEGLPVRYFTGRKLERG